jgi:uncharacterized protein (DUF2336 family)
MSIRGTLIDELESDIAHKPIGYRARALQRVADLFTQNSEQLSNEQIALFDDVMARLVNQIDIGARAAFGRRLLEMTSVPPAVVRSLALDDSIEVAGPILRQLDGVSEETLVEGAMTKSQSHLLAISRRRHVPERVTDVLVERGNHEVAMSTTGNPGAKFSDFGYSTIVRRAGSAPDLAACVWKRTEIPRHHLLILFTAASLAVRQEFQAINPQQANEVESMIGRARDELQTYSREHSPEYLAAFERVGSLQDGGQLTETAVLGFASARQFYETALALSLMGDAPIGFVERSMVNDECDHLLVLAKSIGLSFETVSAILSLRTDRIGGSPADLEEVGVSYQKLQPETARKALQYCRLWERSVQGEATRRS